MFSLFTLAFILLTPLPQEKSKQETPPPTSSKEARDLLSNAKPVKGERSLPAGPSLTQKNLGSGSGGVSGAKSPGDTADAGAKTTTGAGKSASPTSIVHNTTGKVSAMFIENALYQQELANRRQVISVEDIATPEAALAELQAGNGRFAKGERVRTLRTAQDNDLRAALTKGQSPFAVIVTCSDSRAMDSLIFDQELGRIFTIRVAGNSPDVLGLASIEYAVEHLGSKIVVIMGHTKCGAVGAVADAKGEPMHDHLYIFQQLMAGLLEAVPKKSGETDAEYKDRLEQVNAQRQAQIVYDRSNIVRDYVDRKKIWLLPASYDLASGEVTFFNLITGAPRH